MNKYSHPICRDGLFCKVIRKTQPSMKEYVFIYEGIRSDTTYREKNNERCADH